MKWLFLIADSIKVSVISTEGQSETHQLFNQTTYILQTIQLINGSLTVCVCVWFLYKRYEYIISYKSR